MTSGNQWDPGDDYEVDNEYDEGYMDDFDDADFYADYYDEGVVPFDEDFEVYT